jgi:RNA polymerase sigma-70 factor (ECF subfamily)
MPQEENRPSANGDPVHAALADPVVQRRLGNAVGAMLYRARTDPTTARVAPLVEDVVQEVNERALERKERYTPCKGSVLNWAIGFADRVCREILRKGPPGTDAGRGARSLEELLVDLTPPVEEVVGNRLDVGLILERLPTEDQNLLRAWYFEDATAAEIGRRLGISEGAVRVRLWRILGGLRARYLRGGEGRP